MVEIVLMYVCVYVNMCDYGVSGIGGMEIAVYAAIGMAEYIAVGG